VPKGFACHYLLEMFVQCMLFSVISLLDLTLTDILTSIVIAVKIMIPVQEKVSLLGKAMIGLTCKLKQNIRIEAKFTDVST